jgi:hypothetical protein
LVWLKPLASCDDVVVVGASVLTVATEDEAMVHEAEGRGKETLVAVAGGWWRTHGMDRARFCTQVCYWDPSSGWTLSN